MSLMIYLIDDDKVYHLFTRKLFQNYTEAAIQVVEFYDAGKAIQFILENKDNSEKLADIIFLDINMPGLDGWDFLERYKELNLNKKAIIHMATTSVCPEDIEKAKDEKCIGKYLVKPLKMETIKEILQETN